MKKKIVSLISLLMAAVCSFGTLAGCKKDGSSSGNNGGENGDGGYVTKPTGENIIENNGTDYKILIADDATSWARLAATELQLFLEESTGVAVPVVSDSQAGTGGKYISLGKTQLAAQNKVSATYATLGQQGFGIKTVDDDLYIYGADTMNDRGVLYGVYGYLENELNFDYFYTDVYTLDKKDTLALNEYDAIDVPDIQARVSSWTYQSDSPEIMNRMRMMDYYDAIVPVNQTFYHNCMEYFPVEVYNDSSKTDTYHPEFYATSGLQLCYTARGDNDSLKLMKQIVVDTMWNAFNLESYKDYLTIVFALTDFDAPCTCTACQAMTEEYGALSSTVVAFCNDVAVELEKKFEEANDPRVDDFRIKFYAYFHLFNAPVKTDGNGKPVVAEEMKLNDHVIPFFAPLHYNYTDYFDCADNANATQQIDRWLLLTDEFNFWGYDLYNQAYMCPFNSFSSLQYLYQYLAEKGCGLLLMQGQPGQAGASTGFALLKAYLQSKLGWNVNADVPALTEKFFNAMYGQESAEMKKIYNELLLLLKHQREELGLEYDPTRSNPKQVQYWPKNLLKDWMERMTAIEERLEQRGDSRSAKNVRIELASPVYLLVELYGHEIHSDVVLQYKQKFVDIVREVGMTHDHEGDTAVGGTDTGSINEKISEWGLQ